MTSHARDEAFEKAWEKHGYEDEYGKDLAHRFWSFGYAAAQQSEAVKELCEAAWDVLGMKKNSGLRLRAALSRPSVQALLGWEETMTAGNYWRKRAAYDQGYRAALRDLRKYVVQRIGSEEHWVAEHIDTLLAPPCPEDKSE